MNTRIVINYAAQSTPEYIAYRKRVVSYVFASTRKTPQENWLLGIERISQIFPRRSTKLKT